MANIINLGTIKVGATSPRLEDVELTPKTTEETYRSQDCYGYKDVTVKAVTSDIDSNIKPENIMENVSILGVEGTMVGLRGQEKTVSPSTSQQVVTPTNGKNGLTKVTIEPVTSSIDSNIQSSNIKKGVSILSVEGDVIELNGQIKTVSPSTSQQSVVPDQDKNALTEVVINPVTSDIDLNIQSSNIKKDVTILGVEGDVIELNGQTKTVNPSTSQQTVTPDQDKNALTEVTVNPVTSAIDNNIQAGNIKSGVEILGVTGNVTELIGQTKTVNPTNQVQTITPDQGYNGLTEVTVTEAHGDPSEYFRGSYHVASNSSSVGGWIYALKKYVVEGVPTGARQGFFRGYMGESIEGLSTIINSLSATEFSQFFSGCSNLLSIDFTGCNISSFTNMQQVFDNCYNLTSLDLSSFNTSSVTTMSNMFNNCSGLTSLDVSNFDTSSVTTMNSMFRGCGSLTSLTLWNTSTSLVNSFQSMFQNCKKLSTLNSSVLSSSIVGNISSMFEGCEELTSVDISNLSSTSAIQTMYVFKNCKKLTSVKLGGLKTTTTGQMFNGCNALASIDFGNFDTSSATSFSQMFINCTLLDNPDLSGFATTNVTDFSGMFQSCTGMTTLDISNFKIDSCTTIAQMFLSCTHLQTLDISGMDFGTHGSHISSTYATFNSVPSTCTIYVKDQASKDWLINKFGSNYNWVIN